MSGDDASDYARFTFAPKDTADAALCRGTYVHETYGLVRWHATQDFAAPEACHGCAAGTCVQRVEECDAWNSNVVIHEPEAWTKEEKPS